MAFVCDDCTLAVASHAADISGIKRFTHADEALEWHFAGLAIDALVTTSRQFPGHMRADVQTAIDRLFSESAVRFFAIHEQRRYETLTISALTRYADEYAYAVAPAQYHDVDIGEIEPVKCLNNGLWLCVADGLRYAVMLSRPRPALRLPCLPARPAANWCNAASRSWRAPSTPRVVIAARSCRSTPTPIIGDDRRA